MTLSIKVISPDRIVLDTSAEEAILPSTTGQLGILTNHASLLTALDIGVMQVRHAKDWEAIALMGGFAEVEANEVTILVTGAELGAQIDVEAARRELAQAESRLAAVPEDDKRSKLQADTAVRLARARLQAATANR